MAISFDTANQLYGKSELEIHNLLPKLFTHHEEPLLLIEHLLNKYGTPVGCGRTRLTWTSNHIVVKVPRNTWGIECNKNEYYYYEASKLTPRIGNEKPRYARCKLKTFYNLPILFMEKLTVEVIQSKLPQWAFGFDATQVGMDRKGLFKAFDYA